jgi:diphthine synthase
MSTGKLYVVGLGLGTPGYLTQRALELIKTADKVFFEAYTSVPDSRLLEELLKLRPDIVRLEREDCELKNYQVILEALSNGKNVVFLVPGDPMIATTHVNLVLEARARGHQVEMVPGVSIFSAAFALSGLQIYRVGCVVTFPIDYQRTPSVAKKILEAYQASRHSLVLFYYDVNLRKGPSPQELARFLLDHGLPENAWIVVLQRVGFPEQLIASYRAAKLANLRESFRHPVTAIVAAKQLHPIEEEYLKSIEA